MASSKSYKSRPNYQFLSCDQQLQATLSHDSVAFELDESDIYNNVVSTRSDSPEFRLSRVAKKPSTKGGCGRDSGIGGAPTSLPVNIPDWSKILREEHKDNSRRRSESDDDDVAGDDWLEGGVRIPPHEFLARTRIASFSVHEGIGRTLKGRDLRRVRNAIFEKIGFQD
ncbi:uncharacterized protein LOC111304303 [Durio zibethinus]|uniref:Uncharacterized protein LOC111304303 n=1 Tax=Durio zibethinus TaxID=66656 RepID=A0A6P5ZUU2_DURZI|nr:uncharacterized protein LOC111304303 [Durio zibethinus]